MQEKNRGDRDREASFGILLIPVRVDALRFPFCLGFITFDRIDLTILVTDDKGCSFVCFFSQA